MKFNPIQASSPINASYRLACSRTEKCSQLILLRRIFSSSQNQVSFQSSRFWFPPVIPSYRGSISWTWNLESTCSNLRIYRTTYSVPTIRISHCTNYIAYQHLHLEKTVPRPRIPSSVDGRSQLLTLADFWLAHPPWTTFPHRQRLQNLPNQPVSFRSRGTGEGIEIQHRTR